VQTVTVVSLHLSADCSRRRRRSRPGPVQDKSHAVAWYANVLPMDDALRVREVHLAENPGTHGGTVITHECREVCQRRAG
jgi:hypothetical protein